MPLKSKHLTSLLPVLSLCACGASMPQSQVATTSTLVASAARASDAENAQLQRRLVIKTADLTVVTDDPRGGFHKAQRMARQMGGFIHDASRSEKRLRLTLRVPGPRFEEAVRRLGKLGLVEQRQVSGKDVTAEVVDLEIRLSNALKMRERYLALLQKAQNVAEAVEVQKELERVTESIERMKGQLALLRSQVNMATIRLTLETPTRPGPLGWLFYGTYRGVKWLFVWD